VVVVREELECHIQPMAKGFLLQRYRRRRDAISAGQCLISHMIQLAAIVPPTKSTKQKAPKRIIVRGSERCVIPKTIEVKRAKSRTAPK